MAGITQAVTRKRKAPLSTAPITTLSNIAFIDLTVDEDDDSDVVEPVAKRMKEDAGNKDSKLPRTRDHIPLSDSHTSSLQPQVNRSEDPRHTEVNASNNHTTISRTDSESKDVSQRFRLPQTSTIKFEFDASSPPAVHTTNSSVHKKNRHADIERVSTSSSSQRTNLSSTRPTASQAQKHKNQSPIRSQVRVVIPATQNKTQIPILSREEYQNRKQRLLQDITHGINITRERAESVERYFGTTGFSTIYSPAGNDERLKKIHERQPRISKSRRNSAKLDWGVVASTKTLRNGDLMHPRDQIKKLVDRKVNSITSGPPLTFVNDINDRCLNGKFQFVNEYVIREGVKRQPAHVNRHINCKDSCAGMCSALTCSCLRNKKMEAFIRHPVPTYRHRSDGLLVLSDAFMTLSKEESAWTEIVECNNNCLCGKGCYNRVVQQGRTLSLEIFMTKACGFGLRCPKNIVKGQFIDVYLGEVVTEAMLRQRESAQEEGEPSYLFTLDWFNENPSHVHYQIDGAIFGTPMRFVNHSCSSNCSVFPVMLQEYDQNIYGLAVFAVKDIPAMTELTLDYAPQLQYVDAADCVKCQCGEKNCRGYLWPKNTKRARRRKCLRG